MANFGWAYVDCSEAGTETGGQAAGPTGSVQFLTGHNATNGLANFVFHTASESGYNPNTLILSGNLIITGAISASTYHIKDIAVIDATGSTTFGDTTDDVHVRTGSLVVSGRGLSAGLNPALSASAPDRWVKVGGFAGRYQGLATATTTLDTDRHIYGLKRTTAMILNVPEASTVPEGFFWIIKDEVASRTGAGNNIKITSSSPIQQTFDGAEEYILTGTMPAISLYSNGTNWFVF